MFNTRKASLVVSIAKLLGEDRKEILSKSLEENPVSTVPIGASKSNRPLENDFSCGLSKTE